MTNGHNLIGPDAWHATWSLTMVRAHDAHVMYVYNIEVLNS